MRKHKNGIEPLIGLVGLEHVATAQRSEHQAHREHYRHHFAEPFQPRIQILDSLRQIKHRPAGIRIVGIPDAVKLRQRGLMKLRGHAEETQDHHPKQSSRPADHHGHRHSRDVAQSHRCRQRRGQCPERCNISLMLLMLVTPAHHLPCVSKRANVDEAVVERVKNRAKGQEHHHQR